MNEVRIDGKITKKGVEVKYTPSGIAMASFSISRSRKSKRTEEWETEFFEVRAFDKLAESIATLTGKVMVEGYLKQQRWKTDGQERQKIVIMATSVMGEEKKADEQGDIAF